MRNKGPLIIFDCDGVLVDSEPISSRVLAEELRAMGLKLSNEEAIALFTGGKLQDAFEYAATILNKPVPENLESIYRAKCVAAFEKELQPIAGIKNILPLIPNHKCVASNGPGHKVKANLKITELEHFFGEDLFSAYDIQSWKPAPDLFLYAAEKMGFNATESLVIEDSPTGVQAAINAKMKVFAYDPHGANQERFEDMGAIVFNEMSTLPSLITQRFY